MSTEIGVFPSKTQSLIELDQWSLAYKRTTTKVLSYTLNSLVSKLIESGFVWTLPVILSKSTDPLWPDPGASIEKRIEAEIYGHQVRMTTSMIIHKMVFCSLLHPKLFIVSPNVRIEKRERQKTGWHAYEFTQLDFEIRNGNFETVRKTVEKLLQDLIHDVRRDLYDDTKKNGLLEHVKLPKKGFPVFDAQELQRSHGRFWEDEIIKSINTPIWVRNIPREFYDFEDTETGKWDNYDLFVPKYGEILSGAKREWEYEKIIRKMKRDGVNVDLYKELLYLAKEGRLAPSAGAGIGIERLVTWLCDAKNIERVQPFPKIPGVVLDL